MTHDEAINEIADEILKVAEGHVSQESGMVYVLMRMLVDKGIIDKDELYEALASFGSEMRKMRGLATGLTDIEYLDRYWVE